MQFLLPFFFLGNAYTQTLMNPLVFLHDRFTKKLDTNYLFPQIQNQESTLQVCSSSTGTYCLLINDQKPYNLTIEEVKVKDTLQQMMIEIINGFESRRQLSTQNDMIHLYEYGMRDIIDDKLFYEQLENKNPVKFFFDFNNFNLRDVQQPIDKYYMMDADGKVIYRVDNINLLKVQSSEVICTTKNLFLPSLEEMQKYQKYQKKFTGPRLKNYINIQTSQYQTLFPPTEQFIYSDSNQGIIEFSRSVQLHQLFVRSNKFLEEKSTLSITISLYNKDILLDQIKLDHREKFNIWLLCEPLNETITKIVIPPHTQLDSLMVSFRQSELTPENSMKRLIQKLKQIYSSIKPPDVLTKEQQQQQFEIELQKDVILKKESFKTFKSKPSKIDTQNDLSPKITKQNKDSLIKDDIDAQAMNLLLNYVSRLYDMIQKNKKVQEIDMSPEEIHTLVQEFEISLSEKERKTFRSSIDMFLDKKYTEEEIINILNILVQLDEIQKNTEDYLRQQYTKNENIDH